MPDPNKFTPELIGRMAAEVVATPVPERDRQAVAEFLQTELGQGPEDAERLARLSRGAVGSAIRLATEDAQGGGARAAARELLIAALSTGAVPRYAASTAQRPFGGRGGFTDDLEALAEWLRDLMAVAAGADQEIADPAVKQLLDRAGYIAAVMGAAR